MLDIYDYLMGWTVYITGGALCFIIFYRFTGVLRFKPLANTLRAILIAVMFTPWYISPEENLLAPAIIVMALDLVTIGGTSFVRSMVPLTLAVLFTVVVAIVGRVALMKFRESRRHTQ